MLLEVGPFESQQVRAWSKCLRRLVIELRLCAEGSGPVVDAEALAQWTELAETWAAIEPRNGECIRWEGDIEPDRAEYLLHGLLASLRSDFLAKALTADELEAHTPFTLHVIENFLEALNCDGRCDRNYLEQVRSDMWMRADSINLR